MKTAWLLILSLAAGTARGAFDPKCVEPAAGGLGGLLAHHPFLPWGSGPAGNMTFVTFTPGLFNLGELSMTAVGHLRWDRTTALSFSLSRFGGDLYREWEGSVGVLFRVDSLARFGLKVSLMHLGIAGYGSRLAGGMTLLGSAPLADGTELRCALINLVTSEVGPDPVPRVAVCALAWSPGRNAGWIPGGDVRVFVEARLESERPSAWSVGVEWEPVERMLVRGGCSTDHPGFDCGAGFTLAGLRFDYAFRWHRELGGSHLLGFTIDDLL